MAVLGTIDTTVRAHRVISDGNRHLFVCDQRGGALLVRDDPYDAITR